MCAVSNPGRSPENRGCPTGLVSLRRVWHVRSASPSKLCRKRMDLHCNRPRRHRSALSCLGRPVRRAFPRDHPRRLTASPVSAGRILDQPARKISARALSAWWWRERLGFEQGSQARPAHETGESSGFSSNRRFATEARRRKLDPVIPVEHSLEMVKALQAMGGNIKFSLYLYYKYKSWTQTYANPLFWSWLIVQQKGN